MASGLDFQRVTVTISNQFSGPNFVNGLAKQSASYRVVSDTLAILEFAGGFDSGITYVQKVRGEGFGIDADGRYTGTVEGYLGYEKANPQNHWTFQNLDTGLDRLNTLVSDPAITFEDLLLIPLEYDFRGAEFDDLFIAGSFDDILLGFGGDDDFLGLTGADTIAGHGGSDTLSGEDGDDLLFGGTDDDFLFGGRGDDQLFGQRGRDRLAGGEGGDLIHGGGGADEIRGNPGSDVLTGGAGNDTLLGGYGDDSLSGQGGDDVLLGQADGDTLTGGAGNDRVNGGGGTNVLYGQRGNDALVAGSGSDQLFGGAGRDRLSSGTGADFLNGGSGDDRLSGNSSSAGTADHAVDTFIFEAAFGDDVITDFEVGLDGILMAAGITEEEVTTSVVGDDVLVSVDFLGGQSILVQGVAGQFNAAIDIAFA